MRKQEPAFRSEVTAHPTSCIMKPLLVPVDFSDCSANALSFAGAMADRIQSAIYLVHIHQVPLPATDVPVIELPPTEEVEEELLAGMKKLVHTERRKGGWKANVHLVCKTGATTTGINEAAAEAGAGMVVMGMRGKTTLVDRLFGSTASDMIRKSEEPLLLIPDGAGFRPPERIVLAVDYHRPADITRMEIVRELAAAFGSHLHVLSLYQASEESPSDRAVVFGVLEEALKGSDHTIHLHTHENISEGILNFVQEIRAGWLVLFHHSHLFAGRLFTHQHAREVSRAVHIPLLVFSERNTA
jgi:nucleotide-binding universal stress UspA family protein